MANLEVKISYEGQDRAGRVLFFKDSTGLFSDQNEKGYTEDNLSRLESYRFSFSRYDSPDKYIVVNDFSSELLPTLEEILAGERLAFTTDMITGEDESLIVSDGVLDVNMYVEMRVDFDVEIFAGSSITTLDPHFPENFSESEFADAILVDGKIYEIDKSQTNYDYSVLYILGTFETDATKFSYLYRSNIKVFINTNSSYLHSFAVKKLKNDLKSQDWDLINTALSFMISASLWFEVGDYAEAHEELMAANKLLNKFLC